MMQEATLSADCPGGISSADYPAVTMFLEGLRSACCQQARGSASFPAVTMTLEAQKSACCQRGPVFPGSAAAATQREETH